MATRSSSVPPKSGTQAAPRWRTPAMLRALRHRNYRLFFFGQLISLTGTWMQSVAQGWLVLSLTGSPLLLGLTTAMNSLPVLLFSLPAGTIIDRVSKHRVLLITQVTAMLLAAILTILTLTNSVTVSAVLVLALLLGIVNTFDATTRQSFTVEMVGKEDLLNAIALNASIFNAARTIGPAVAGIIVALIGEGPAFLLNTLSFLPVIASLLLMRLPPYTPKANSRARGQLRAGLHYITNEPRVRALLQLAAAISLFSFAYIPLVPIFARDVLNSGAEGLGMLSASNGFGALIAALILAQFGDKLPRGRMVIAAAILQPLFLIAFTFMRDLGPAMVCLFFSGWAGVTCMALSNTLIQSIVPDALRGRVMSVFTLLLMGLSPMGGLAVGAVAEWVGNVPLTVAASAAISCLLSLLSLTLSPQLRRL
ncbi:MFS transporter [Candidatus Gracilibacteria bacterium]|nr:MFS transporter [Candidatus Gracilibacteria bacterium]